MAFEKSYGNTNRAGFISHQCYDPRGNDIILAGPTIVSIAIQHSSQILCRNQNYDSLGVLAGSPELRHSGQQ